MEAIDIINKQIVIEKIKTPELITSLDHNISNNIIAGADKKGRIIFFDIRQNKAINFLRCQNESEIKYFLFNIYSY